MAVTVGTTTHGVRQFTAGRTIAHTTDVGVYRVMLVWVFTGGSIGYDVTAISHDGIDILANVLIDKLNSSGNDARVHCFYVIAPSLGAANIVYTLTGNCFHACSAQAWVGVDPNYSFGVPVTAGGADNAPTVDVHSEADEVVVDGACYDGGGALAISLGAGQTEILRVACGVGADRGDSSYF